MIRLHVAQNAALRLERFNEMLEVFATICKAGALPFPSEKFACFECFRLSVNRESGKCLKKVL